MLHFGYADVQEITLDMGPTELRPASQFLTRELGKQMMLAKVRLRIPIAANAMRVRTEAALTCIICMIVDKEEAPQHNSANK